MGTKIQVSQDFLYSYLQEHNFTVSLLAERMGVSVGIVYGCFNHNPNRLGKPLKFSVANLERLNAVLPQIADELRSATLVFGSDETFTNSWGRTYDPAVRQPVLDLAKYFKLTPFLLRLLGWKKGRRDMILVSRNSPVYGQVSQDDVNRINMELLSVAGVLGSYEVVPDEGEGETGKPVVQAADNKKDVERNEWDDTSLDLWERYARFHRLFPDGMIAFSVNSGYTVCEDDARMMAAADSTLQPFTDISTGHVTLYMDADQMAAILPRLVADGRRVMMTDMYRE